MTQRIINNKHYSDSTLITRDKFLSDGEIVISNEYGFEGIYILNTNGDVVRIGYKSGGSSGSTDSGGTEEFATTEFVRNYLKAQAYMTSAKTAEMLSVLETALSALNADYQTHKAQNIIDINTLNDRIDNIVIPSPSSGGSGYDPTVVAEINARISDLSGATEAHAAQNVVDFQSLNDRIDALSDLIVEPVTDEHISELAALEVAKIVASAETSFETLQEIANWISNDPTRAAQLINRIEEISGSVISVSDDVNDLGAAIIETNDKLAELSASTEDLKEYVEAYQPDTSGLAELSASTVALQEYVETYQPDTTAIEELHNQINETESNVEELSASTEALKEYVETHSGDTGVFELLKAYIDEQIRNLQRDGDHVFLTRGQYNELIRNGSVVISGETYYYSDSIYYCIYEPVAPTPSGSSYDYDEQTGMVNISGITVTDGIAEIDATVDEDGYATIIEAEPLPDEEPVIDEDGFVEIGDDQIDEDGYVTVPDNWEII